MKKIHLYLYICLLSFIGFSCHKENDTNSPVITIVKPVKGSIYSVYDTIDISAVISDESVIESVKVSLLDQDLKPVMATQQFYPSTSGYNLNTSLQLDDIHLPGGTYSIQVKAFDGTNFTNAYINVLINEVPKELKSVLLVSKSGIYGTDLSTLNGNGTWHKILTINGDFKNSDISSYDQLIYTSGAHSGNLNAIFLPQGSLVWNVPLMSFPPYRYFEDLFFSWPLLYVAYYNGMTYGYDRQGTVVYSTNIFGDYFPEHIGIVNKQLLAILKSKSGNTSLLVTYYQGSGSIMQSTNIGMSVTSFEEEDNDNVLVFGNDANIGKIMEYTLSKNKLRFLHEFPDGRIIAVTKREDGSFYIAGANAVHLYIRLTNSLVEFLPAKPTALVDFDEVNKQLYTLSDHNLTAYDFMSGQQTLNIPVADSALALHLLYNK